MFDCSFVLDLFLSTKNISRTYRSLFPSKDIQAKVTVLRDTIPANFYLCHINNSYNMHRFRNVLS